MIPALLQIGPLLGVVLGVGGMIFAIYAVLPAEEALTAERDAFRDRLRSRARVMTVAAVILILGTGLLKWTPPSWGLGGIGWLGGEGKYTGILHTKLLLGLLSLYFAFRGTLPSTCDAKRIRLTKASLHMGLAVIVLAVLHNLRALG